MRKSAGPPALEVVLVRPLYAGNVGGAVRAAANFGARRVRLVAPRCSLDDQDFVKMAMGGQEHVDITHELSVRAAVADVEVAVATTSGRARDPRALQTPAEVAARLAEAAPSSVALVFGSERGGLSAAELRACQILLAVPTVPTFPVLNVAQAVAVVLAMLSRRPAPSPPRSPLDTPASAGEFGAAVDHLHAALLATGFLDAANPARVGEQLRRLLGRAVPTRRELAILRGMASHITYLAGQHTRQLVDAASPSNSARASRPVTRRKRSASPSTGPPPSSSSRRSTR